MDTPMFIPFASEQANIDVSTVSNHRLGPLTIAITNTTLGKDDVKITLNHAQAAHLLAELAQVMVERAAQKQ